MPKSNKINRLKEPSGIKTPRIILYMTQDGFALLADVKIEVLVIDDSDPEFATRRRIHRPHVSTKKVSQEFADPENKQG